MTSANGNNFNDEAKTKWKSYQQGKNPKGFLVFQILYWLLLGALVFFAYLNINPYMVAVKLVLSGIESPSSLVDWLLTLPLLGAILGAIAASIYWVLGTILWGVIQILEIAPMLLERDKQYLESLVVDAENHKRFAIKDEDDPLLARMKQAYNILPVKHYKDFKQMAFSAYAVDFCICLAVYPPVEGGISKLFYALMSGQFNLINWKNVVLAIVTLFAIEATLKIVFMVGSVAYRKNLTPGTRYV